jgi:UDPglucose 6-dehydrogenase
LIKTSTEYDSEINILTVVDKVNKAQKLKLVEKAQKFFNGDIKGKHFSIWGLAFKPNTDDMREAPSVVIINELLKLGATMSIYDPAAMETSKFYLKDNSSFENIKYAENEYDVLKDADALFILTEWNEFRNPDYDKMKSGLKNPIIFDGRNIFAPDKMKELGFTYYSIGRNRVS